MCHQEWEASWPLVRSLLQREVLGPFTQRRPQNADFVLFKRTKIVITGWSGKSKAKQKFFSLVATCHLFPHQVPSQSVSTELMQKCYVQLFIIEGSISVCSWMQLTYFHLSVVLLTVF